MSENCTHDCSSCGETCSEREQEQNSFRVDLGAHSSVKKVIGIVSGKGGVGKSLVTSLLAVNMKKKGHNVAILDADITGPSIPKAFGITNKAVGSDFGILPEKSKLGIDIMSINLLLENDTEPVVWRGPIIAGTVKQFWSEVVWEDEDYMFVDMPPGTGDVPLTVFQSLPVDGIIIISSTAYPQSDSFNSFAWKVFAVITSAPAFTYSLCISSTVSGFSILYTSGRPPGSRPDF